jgi:hypothetical protein
MPSSPLSRTAAILVTLCLALSGAVVVAQTASGATGTPTVRHLEALTRSAASRSTPVRGHRAAVAARGHFSARWRGVSTVGRVAARSFTVRVGHRAACVYWPHRRATTASGSCRSSRHVLGLLTRRASAAGDAATGHARAVRARARLSAALRSRTRVLRESNGQFGVVVRPFRRCVSWSGGQARVTNGRCRQGGAPSSATGPLFGFYPGVEGAGDWSLSTQQRTNRIASRLGRPHVVRIYFDGLPPASFAGSKADLGVPVVLSFKADPAKVAAGEYDARLRSFFDSIPSHLLVWWSFFHEPEDNIQAGDFTAAQYRAAWRHLLQIVPKRSTLRSTLILMRWDLQSRVLHVSDYVVPGVDVLAWDAYVRTWSPTVRDAYGAAAKVSASYHMGFGIAETSIDNHMANPPSRERVVRDVVSQARVDRAQFVTWFETNKSDGDWRLAPYTRAADLWRQLTSS